MTTRTTSTKKTTTAKATAASATEGPRTVARSVPTRARGHAKPEPEEDEEDADADADGNAEDEDSHEAADDGGPLPAGVVDATKRLASSVQRAASRRTADLLNGGAGAVRLGSGMAGLFGKLVRQQSNNARLVAREAFSKANGLGDSVGRGAINTMRVAADVNKEAARQMAAVLDASGTLGKKVSRLGGAAAAMPLAVSGHWTDVSRRMVTVPTNLSRRAADGVSNRILPLVGGDKDGGDDEDGGEPPKKPKGKRR